MSDEQVARDVYAEGLALIEAHGWKRTEPGDGWFWHDNHSGDYLFADALHIVLRELGVDTREEPIRLIPARTTGHRSQS